MPHKYIKLLKQRKAYAVSKPLNIHPLTLQTEQPDTNKRWLADPPLAARVNLKRNIQPTRHIEHKHGFMLLKIEDKDVKLPDGENGWQ